MKKIFKLFLKYYLKIIVKIILLINKPKIIAIAGSTNKYFVKQELKDLFEAKNISVRISPNNFNTEIGLPLAILDLPSGYNSFMAWLPIIKCAPLKLFKNKFPKYLILDLGISDRGDMKYLLSLIGQPDISIITDINQRHLEGFNDMNELVLEYQILLDKTKKNGVIFLNSDNLRINQLGKESNRKIIYYGQSDQSEYQIKKIEKNISGIIVKIITPDADKTINIKRFGEHHAYARVVSEAIGVYI